MLPAPRRRSGGRSCPPGVGFSNSKRLTASGTVRDQTITFLVPSVSYVFNDIFFKKTESRIGANLHFIGGISCEESKYCVA